MARSYCRFPSVRLRLWVAGSTASPLRSSPGPSPNPKPLAVVLNRRGAHRLEIDFELPLVRTGPAGRFSVTLSPVPVGRFRFDLPDRNLLVRVNGSSTRHRHLVADGNESIELGVDAGGPLRGSWQPKQAADAADGLVQLESFTSIHVSDPGVRHRGHYRFRVRQGSLPEATFVLPSTVSVQRVVGVDVGGWDVETENGQRRLRVFFRRRVDERRWSGRPVPGPTSR
ncbi:MAG: hypothetical protein Ct9H300mP1_00670 [Planctomycetaceae bacterium]|nr:MAG: hypothetical protein Ct9H300mP1_00670 [Planctomycetaceae bacterium]